MSPRRAVCLVSFWLVIVVTYLLTVRQAKHVRSQQQQTFGHFTEHEIMERVVPIIHTILPNKNDLYVNAYYGEAVMADGIKQRVWNIDCTDNQDNDLIHIACDADSGRICWMGNARGNMLARPLPISLSSQMAGFAAQRWMVTLGFRETWRMQGPPRHSIDGVRVSEVRWLVTLERPGWRARMSLDIRTGALMYASILAIR